MHADVERTIRNFREVFYGGIPLRLQRNETSFLSFMCALAATDALAGWRYADDLDGKKVRDGDRFEQLVQNYFAPEYKPHAANLHTFRCRVLHNFSPAYFSARHAAPSQHLRPSDIGDPLPEARMLERIANILRGGAIFFSA